MAHYLVTGRPVTSKLHELRNCLDSGEIRAMKPFGQALHKGLTRARWQRDGIAIWEEEDYCTPPLAQERRAVLDQYFTELSVEKVEKDAGWERINALPQIWGQSVLDEQV